MVDTDAENKIYTYVCKNEDNNNNILQSVRDNMLVRRQFHTILLYSFLYILPVVFSSVIS